MHPGALLVERREDELVPALTRLVTDDVARRVIAERGRANARRFDANIVVPRLGVTLDQGRNRPAGFSR